MKLIAGLGNPGGKYALTRHNIGFMALDALAQSVGADSGWRSEQKAHTLKLKIGSESFLLVKPQTFMNLSGESIVPLMKYYDVPQTDLLVVHDEIDQPYGKLKFQIRRGAGGHNGIKSIHQHIGNDDYARLRVGVGRPSNEKMEVADYVLQNFSKEEMTSIPDFLNLIIDGIEFFVEKGFEKAASEFNNKSIS